LKNPDRIKQENNDGTAGGTQDRITGGASGIGRAARLFRREGAAVAILGRCDSAAKAVDEIGAGAIACDVSDPASVSAAVSRQQAMGGLDGVVYAGILAETGSPTRRRGVLAPVR
jgi:NAD(P)-dependent dehydrogenase (short-subunit alcohol dehydrogenase family)